jgi:hypothetical protein
MPSSWSRLRGSSTVGAGTGLDDGEITEILVLRVVPSIPNAWLFMGKGLLPLATTSERAKHWIAGRDPLSWNPLPDDISFGKRYPVGSVDW